MESFVQFSATTEILVVRRRPDGTFVSPAGRSLHVEPSLDKSGELLLRGPAVANFWKDCRLGISTRKDQGTAYGLRPADESACRIIGARRSAAELAAELKDDEHLVLRRFVRHQPPNN